jgi:hypothetical protein
MFGPLGMLGGGVATIGQQAGFKTKAEGFIKDFSQGRRTIWYSDSTRVVELLTFTLLYFAFQADNEYWQAHNRQCIRNIMSLFPYHSTNNEKTIKYKVEKTDFIKNLKSLVNHGAENIDKEAFSALREEAAKNQYPYYVDKVTKEQKEQDELVRKNRKIFVKNSKNEFFKNFDARKEWFFGIMDQLPTPRRIPQQTASFGIAWYIDAILSFTENHYPKILAGIAGLLYMKYLIKIRQKK